MSQETLATLNTQTLIGYTAKRGTAWHYRAEEQGEETNHYEGAVPVEDVRRRLFNWHAVEGTITATHISDDGVLTSDAPAFKAIMRSDTGKVLHIPSARYQIHDYDQWLIENVSMLLDADLHIGSAGLLRDGGQAWVQIEMEETIEAAEGVRFRPWLTAATSHDGSLSTTYLRGVQVVVCDNTLSAALGDDDSTRVKVRHSSASLKRIGEVREALEIVYSTADDFMAQLNQLTKQHVSDSQWDDFLRALVNVKDNASPRSKAMADSKIHDLTRLWNYDESVAPWRNSAYGVLAAVNTYTHHYQTVKGVSRGERNMSRAISGDIDKLDAGTLRILASVS